jgi:hypothetical protein
MPAARAFAAGAFAAADGFDCAFSGVAAFDADIFSAADFAALADFAVDCAAAFFTGFFTGFFMVFFLDM